MNSPAFLVFSWVWVSVQPRALHAGIQWLPGGPCAAECFTICWPLNKLVSQTLTQAMQKNTSKGWDWEQLTLSDLGAESSFQSNDKGEHSRTSHVCKVLRWLHTVALHSHRWQRVSGKGYWGKCKAEIHNLPGEILQKMYHFHTVSAEAVRTPMTERMLAKRTE